MHQTNSTRTLMRNVRNETADLIAKVSPSLSAAWKAAPTPRRRVDLAFAFAAGFNTDSPEGTERDIHPLADTVIQVALQLQQINSELLALESEI